MATEAMVDAVARADSRPLIVHVVYRFDTGGLENGVVNLINHLPADRFRHAVVALTEVTGFAARLKRTDVNLVSLHKPPGHALRVYPGLWRLFRRLAPAVVHTRNIAALEAQVPAWLAGVPVRIHGEHGRDVDELGDKRARYRTFRRLYRPFVQHQIALSGEIACYLRDEVGVRADALTELCNGVDTQRFRPAPEGAAPPDGCPFDPARHVVVGTVGRMQAVKDQTLLAQAFVQALASEPTLRQRLRLALVGDGPLRAACDRLLVDAGVRELAWLPGERADVPEVMRGFSLFVLPSRAEGISNTILEAMACGLPVLATGVGGNASLIDAGVTGELVPAGDVQALASRIAAIAADPDRMRRMGAAGRARAEARFSLGGMVAAYQHVYESRLRRAGALRGGR